MIRWAFTNPKSPACFSSAKRIHALVRKKFPETSLGDVEEVLIRIPAYTLHKKRRVRFKRLQVVPDGWMTDLQVDLADMQKFQENGFNYILVGVDVLSRKLFATPVKTKGSIHMIPAFKRLFRQMPQLPYIIFSDKGLEFQATMVLNMLKGEDIKKYIAQSPDVKACIAERFIRTLKGRLFKHGTYKETGKWVEILPDLVDAINKSISRATGMAPNDVTQENATELWDKLYRHNPPILQPKFEVGDKVRITKHKTVFDKSYVPNYTHEVFVIIGMFDKRKRPYYKLQSMNGENIVGKFYQEELSRVMYPRDPKLVVAAVLKTRKYRGVKQYFVRWVGKPDEHNTWITESDLL